MRPCQKILSLAGAASVMIAAAQAHVRIDNARAEVGSKYRAAFSVGHGCSGSPTVKLRIQIPPGVVAVEAEPKDGWELKTVSGPYDRWYASGGTTFKQGVTEVIWSGLLSAHHAGVFVLNVNLSDSLQAGSKLYFPVVQECQSGVERWIDRSAEEGDHPAPDLTLLPRQ
jgi:uncharacterized protein YcnI